MALAAIELGYEYLAICDHTPAVGVVPGLDADGLRRQAIEIDAANEALAPFRVLRGTECDILPDGRLDLSPSILRELDWVQASVHGGQRLPKRKQTQRVERALRSGYVSCLSHPKGRYINRRPENELDIDRLIEIALDEDVALEVNGLPDRLDLRDVYVRQAVEAGAKLVCSTDAHSIRGLSNMEFSVATARRGWATAGDVLNTLPVDSLVDVERFAAELPGLWDDFPRSPAPSGQRFDDVIAGIPNLAEENVLALLNLAASLLGPGRELCRGRELLRRLPDRGDAREPGRLRRDRPLRVPRDPDVAAGRCRARAATGSRKPSARSARSARRSSKATCSSWSRAVRSATGASASSTTTGRTTTHRSSAGYAWSSRGLRTRRC